MTRTLTLGAALWAAAALSSRATASITLWSGNTGDVNIVDLSGTVTILAAGTFKFQSVTAGSLDAINHIFINNGVTGTVSIYVARNPAANAGTAGATNVGEVDLTNNQGASLTGNLVDLNITGNLGTLGPIVFFDLLGNVNAADVVDAITMNHDVGSTGHIHVGQLGDVTINRWFLGSIECNSMGNLTCPEATGTGVGGNLTIHGGYSGAIIMHNHLAGGWVIDGNLTGTITVGTTPTRNLTGTIAVGGDLAVPGRIIISGNAGNTDDPPIRVHGSVTCPGCPGSPASAPLIYIGGQLSGTLAIDGSLADANGSGPEIQIGNGTLGTLGAVAINYDGASGADNDWASGAAVLVGSNSYSGNNRAAFVWNVIRCKGDMNGDRVVSGADQTEVFNGNTNSPFDDALNHFSDYRTDYPGLEGSAAGMATATLATALRRTTVPRSTTLFSRAATVFRLCPIRALATWAHALDRRRRASSTTRWTSAT